MWRNAMKLALLADIHSNLEALTACLAHAREQGAERYAFIGDLVGYGADPGAVVDLVADHRARGAVVVRGNHDHAVVAPSETMNPAAERAVAWTRDRLSAAQRAFLGELPLVERLGDALFVHASADAPSEWIYVSDPVRAEALAVRFRAGVALKGAGTVCAAPDGTWSINRTGNPGLASGGTGDVLSGIVGAFLAGEIEPFRALMAGVCAHGAAADLLVTEGVGPIGMTASELGPAVRRLLNER